MTPEQIEAEAEEFKKRPHYSNGQALSCCPQIYLKRGYIAGRSKGLEREKELEEEIKIVKKEKVKLLKMVLSDIRDFRKLTKATISILESEIQTT